MIKCVEPVLPIFFQGRELVHRRAGKILFQGKRKNYSAVLPRFFLPAVNFRETEDVINITTCPPTDLCFSKRKFDVNDKITSPIRFTALVFKVADLVVS